MPGAFHWRGARARPAPGPDLPGQRPLEQELERARDDDRRIPIRNLMRQEIL